MKYCGIELKSSEARIVSIQVDESGDYNIIASKTKKIKLTDPKSQEGAQYIRLSNRTPTYSHCEIKNKIKNIETR